MHLESKLALAAAAEEQASAKSKKAQGVNDQTSRKVCSNGHDDDGEDTENLHVPRTRA